MPASGRFILYGDNPNVLFWREWFAQQAGLRTFTSRDLGGFGDVRAVLFERPTR